jgi:OFA family oxalate/formate antiporter-like MFS transporter
VDGPVGTRIVALTSGVLYGLGIFLASFAGQPVLLYLTYGLMAGIGIGLGYIVPLATLIKVVPRQSEALSPGSPWPGSARGAFVTALIAKRLVSSVGAFQTFTILGIIYLVMVVGAALFMRNPPEGYRPPGWEPDTAAGGDTSGVNYDLGGALKTWQWFALWALLFLNVTAGIAIITEAAPMAETIAGVSAVVAATLVSIISVGNALGRFFWAWLSDRHRPQVGLFHHVPLAGGAPRSAAVPRRGVVRAARRPSAFIISLLLRRGFGHDAGLQRRLLRLANVGKIYGLMLTAWGFGGVLGPLLISYIIDSTGSYTPPSTSSPGSWSAARSSPISSGPPTQRIEAPPPTEGARA